jgi:hypothetical protein
MRRLTALLAVVVLAGCGGGDRLSKADYQREVHKVGETLGSSIRGLGDLGNNPNLKEASKQIEELQDALRKAADDLDGLEPPADIGSAHDELVEGIHGFADELDELSDATADGDVQRIREFEAQFSQSDAVEKIRDASAELEQKGYKIE